MASVYVSPKAAEDLANIKDYIENELKSPKAAKDTVLKIIRTYEMLSDFPEMGSFLETDNVSLLGYRHVLADDYVVFYRVANDDVYVIRILHRLMDYLKVLL